MNDRAGEDDEQRYILWLFGLTIFRAQVFGRALEMLSRAQGSGHALEAVSNENATLESELEPLTDPFSLKPGHLERHLHLSADLAKTVLLAVDWRNILVDHYLLDIPNKNASHWDEARRRKEITTF